MQSNTLLTDTEPLLSTFQNLFLLSSGMFGFSLGSRSDPSIHNRQLLHTTDILYHRFQVLWTRKVAGLWRGRAWRECLQLSFPTGQAGNQRSGRWEHYQFIVFPKSHREEAGLLCPLNEQAQEEAGVHRPLFVHSLFLRGLECYTGLFKIYELGHWRD